MALRLEEPKPCPPGRDTPQRQVRYWRSASPAGGPVWVRYVPGLGEARHRSETVKFVAGAAPVVLRRRAVLPRAAAHPHHGRRAGRVCARPTGSLRRAQRPTPHSMSVASNGWRRPAVVCPRRQIYADLDRHRHHSSGASDMNSVPLTAMLVKGNDRVAARVAMTNVRPEKRVMRAESSPSLCDLYRIIPHRKCGSRPV